MSEIKDMLLDAIEQKDFAYMPEGDSVEVIQAKLDAYEQACDDISDLVRGILP